MFYENQIRRNDSYQIYLSMDKFRININLEKLLIKPENVAKHTQAHLKDVIPSL